MIGKTRNKVPLKEEQSQPKVLHLIAQMGRFYYGLLEYNVKKMELAQSYIYYFFSEYQFEQLVNSFSNYIINFYKKKYQLDSFMDRLFVYRTVPVSKFQFSSNSRRKPVNSNLISKSQKDLSGNKDRKILFKTRKNILLENYGEKDIRKMEDRSILVSQQRPRKPRKFVFNKINTQMNDIKFHEIDLNNLTWQKWNRPFNIVRANKKNLTQRQDLSKRMFTDPDRNQTLSCEREALMIKNVVKQKKMERQINQLRRFKRSVERKKQTISLMQKIQSQRNQTVRKAFQGFRQQMEQICDFYKTHKLVQDYQGYSRHKTVQN